MFRHVYVLRFTKQSKTLYTMYEKIIGRRDWKVIDHMYVCSMISRNFS
jgi:hypothetical protein